MLMRFALTCLFSCLLWLGCATTPPASAPVVVPTDEERFVAERAALERRCADGSARTCRTVGVYLWRGLPEARDEPAAYRMMTRACALGDEAGCLEAALMEELGIGTTRDLELALGRYRSACREPETSACRSAARVSALRDYWAELDAQPSVTPGDSASTSSPAEGGLHRDVIKAAIDMQRESVRFCYERELQRQPDVAGKVVFRFVIGMDGRVSRIEEKKSELPVHLDECIEGVVRRIRFPRPVGGGEVTVTFPWIFKPA